MVGRYLVAAELASDPEQAYRYAQAARHYAARIGVVRELSGITAYKTDRWTEALAELRAARRLTGRNDYLALMADAERGLGRLDRALDVVHSPEAKRLPRAAQIELRIVESGIRRDQGLADAAVLALAGSRADRRQAAPVVGPALLRLRRRAARGRPRRGRQGGVRPRRRRRRGRADRRPGPPGRARRHHRRRPGRRRRRRRRRPRRRPPSPTTTSTTTMTRTTTTTKPTTSTTRTTTRTTTRRRGRRGPRRRRGRRRRRRSSRPRRRRGRPGGQPKRTGRRTRTSGLAPADSRPLTADTDGSSDRTTQPEAGRVTRRNASSDSGQPAPSAAGLLQLVQPVPDPADVRRRPADLLELLGHGRIGVRRRTPRTATSSAAGPPRPRGPGPSPRTAPPASPTPTRRSPPPTAPASRPRRDTGP